MNPMKQRFSLNPRSGRPHKCEFVMIEHGSKWHLIAKDSKTLQCRETMTNGNIQQVICVDYMPSPMCATCRRSFSFGKYYEIPCIR